MSLLAQTAATHLRLQVGPAVAVSDSATAALEPFIAADPTNANRLVVSVSEVVPDHGIVPRAYFSDFAGARWTRTELPQLQSAVETNRLRQGVDTWLAYSPEGVLFYSALAIVRTPGQNSPSGWGHDPTPPDDPWGRASVLVFRSDDHGKTFAAPAAIRGRSFDAPKIAASSSWVVVSATVSASDPVVTKGSGAKELIAVYRSDDSARTFRPIGFFGPDTLGHNPLNPSVLPDGSLVVGWFDHPTFGNKGPDQPIHGSRLFVMSAADAEHFGVPDVAGDVARTGLPAVPRMTTDTWAGSPFRGRSYVVWNGGDAKRADLAIAFSNDPGSHWSSPVSLSAGEGTAVFAEVATAPDGTVGALWGEHETTAPFTSCWRYYFAYSSDGGVTFSSPATVQPDRVCPNTAENRNAHYPGWGQVDTVADDWPHGGHYIGLTASADGAFHPVWIDSRDGLFRAYTTAIRVTR